MRKIFFICLTVLSTLSVAAQKTKKELKDEKKQRINALIKQEEEGVIAYRKHTVFGFKLINDGYGAFLEIGKAQSVKKALLFQIELSERKHQKEQKQSDPYLPTSPYIFGKINYFYPLKLGVQQQILLGNKTNKNGVAVTANFGGGLSLGLLRPYYLDVNDVNSRKSIKFDGPDSTTFSTGSTLRSLQASSAGFGKGWGEMKLTPGAYGKASLRFDYGRYNEMVNALEVGISLDFYSKKIPQLVVYKQEQLFMSIYVAILFGRRR
jgi:hypothetical protein